MRAGRALRRGDNAINRILIFLLGSLGDTLVALPALRLVARRYPSAQRRVLTDRSTSPKAASMDSLLQGTGLVHDYYWFPPPAKRQSRLGPMLALARSIRTWKPEALIYLHEQRGQIVAWRDAAMFRALGIPRLIGVPLTRNLQRSVFHEHRGRFEHRSEYLARSLSSLGDSQLSNRASWDLAFSSAERRYAERQLLPLEGCPGVIGMSIGTKLKIKDWGDDNWLALLEELSSRLPNWGLVAIGAPSEYERTANLLSAWRGPSLNSCGKLSVRESGTILERLDAFVGHDSGPMHLAATVGTPCTAIFSARNLPGLWFPYGDIHKVIYHQTPCAGCKLDECVEFNKKCITSISVSEVLSAVLSLLPGRASAPARHVKQELAGPKNWFTQTNA
jgi:ADP-heptose:LPS heptosyltransferase